LDVLHQDRANELSTALFNRPEVLAADVGLDTEVRPIPAFSDANRRRLEGFPRGVACHALKVIFGGFLLPQPRYVPPRPWGFLTA